MIKSCRKWFLCGNIEACLQKKDVQQLVSLIAMNKRIMFMWASNTAGVIMFFCVKSLCSAEHITKDAKENQRPTQSEKWNVRRWRLIGSQDFRSARRKRFKHAIEPVLSFLLNSMHSISGWGVADGAVGFDVFPTNHVCPKCSAVFCGSAFW